MASPAIPSGVPPPLERISSSVLTGRAGVLLGIGSLILPVKHPNPPDGECEQQQQTSHR
jgi:hypothetical protein